MGPGQLEGVAGDVISSVMFENENIGRGREHLRAGPTILPRACHGYFWKRALSVTHGECPIILLDVRAGTGLLSLIAEHFQVEMNCSLCTKPATVRCPRRCGYIACDHCGHAQPHSCGTKWTPAKILKFYSSGEMIGRGGFGRVYGNQAMDPNVAIKFSRNRESCADFEVEFKLASRIHTIQKQLNFVDENYELISVYADVPDVTLPDSPDESHCAFVMQRVHKPTIEFGSDNRMSYQAYLGTDENFTASGRGNYIGTNELRNLVGQEQLEALGYSAGRFLAFLHYGAKVDAGDMEYIIGHVAGSDKLKVYALDFDRVKKINDYTPATIKELEWSISAESYFPFPGDQLYPLFRKGYFQVSAQMGNAETAKRVIEIYEENN